MSQLPGPFDADYPQEPQTFPWTCSIRSAAWCLWSLGSTEDVESIGAEMVARGLVTPEYGLMDGSGAGLAGYLAEKSGWPADNRFPVAWDELPDYGVGEWPCALGGSGWYHWVGARGIQNGMVYLANSADGYMGVGQWLSQADFERLGPFALVWIAYEEDALSQSDQEELAAYRAQQPYYDTALGTPEQPGGLVGQALGTMEAACADAGLDHDTLAAQVLGQCHGLRASLGL